MSVTLRVALPMPDEIGKPIFEEHVFDHRPGATVYDYLEIKPEQIGNVIYAGGVFRPDDARYLLPKDGDVLHVLPNLEGKNMALVLGIVGAVVGFYFAGPGGAQAGWTWGAALSGAMTGYAIGSTIGALLTPQPKMSKTGDDAITSHMWQGIGNEDRPGVAIPVPFGEHKTGGVRIGAFTRRVGNSEKLFLLLLVGHGPIDSISDIRVQDQPYTNYPNVEVDTRLGTTGQSVIPGFNAIANTYAQNVDLTQLGAGVSYTYTSVRADLDAFEVLLTAPGIAHTSDKGDQKTNATVYKLEYRKVGDATWINADAAHGNQSTIKASTRSTVFETRRIENLTPGQYDIRLTWISAENTDATRDLWHIFLTGITEEKQDSRTYDGYALIALKAIAIEQLQGAIPTLTAKVRGLKLPTWNGSSFTTPSWTSTDPNTPHGRNNAWIILEILRNKKWGLGNDIPDSNIDLGSFKRYADYCNEMTTVTPDAGAPYDEARHQIDVVLNQQTDALDLLEQLCSLGRGVLVLSGNRWRIVIDKPDVPVQLFTMGNVRRGTFNIQIRSDGERTNAYDVTINDRDREYDSNPFTVVSKQQVTVLGKPQRNGQLNLTGITRRSHAKREAIFRLNSIQYLKRLIMFEAGADAILCEAGDLISFSHDVPQWGYSGRLLPDPDAVDGVRDMVTLDRLVTVEAGKVYEITIRPNDGTSEAGWIGEVWGDEQAAGTGDYARLKLHTACPFQPDDGCIFAFGQKSISTKPFRVIAITRSDDGFRKITAIEYNESVASDADIIEVISYTDLPNWGGPPAPITNAKAYEEISNRKDDRWISNVIVQWTKPLPSRQYAAYIGAKIERSWDYDPLNAPAATWEDWSYTDGTEARWYDAPHGTRLAFRITPKGANGRYNVGGAAIVYVDTQGYSTAPSAVSGFAAEVRDNAFNWTWNAPGQQYVTELRKLNSGWGDNDPTNLVYRGDAHSYTLDSPQVRSQQLFAKLLDMNHNYSVGAVSATAADAAPPAPTLGPVERYKNNLKIKVTPVVPTADYIGIHLHASQTPGFTPRFEDAATRNITGLTRSGLTASGTTSAAHGFTTGDYVLVAGAAQAEYNGTFLVTVTGTTTFTYQLAAGAAPATPATGTITAQAKSNRVAQVVGPQGGEFVHAISTSGNWYYKATVEDWLSVRLNDWIYSGEISSSLLVIVPAAPSAVTIGDQDTESDGSEGRGIKTQDGGATLTPIRVHRKEINWSFTDNPANPAGSLLGFQVIIYETDPNTPLIDSGVMSTPAQRQHVVPDFQLRNAKTLIAAVKSVYSDSITSPYVTSTGVTLDPGVEPPLATSAYVDQRLADIDLPETCVDYWKFDKNATGVRGTAPLANQGSASFHLDGYGIVIETPNQQKLDSFDLTGWTLSGCTVAKVTDNSVLPPLRAVWELFNKTTWDVYAVTVTASNGAHSIRRTVSLGNRVGSPYNFSFYAYGKRTPSSTITAQVSDNAAFTSSGGTTTLLPGVWTRVQSGAVAAWPNTNTNRAGIISVAAGGMGLNDVYYVAIPQLSENYFAHFPAATASTGTGHVLMLPPGPLSADNWTAMFRFRRIPQSTGRYAPEVSDTGNLFELSSGVAGQRILLYETFSTGLLTLLIGDGNGNSWQGSATLPVSGLEENALAVVRSGNTYKVYLNNGILITPFNTSASATARGAFTAFALGNDHFANNNPTFNGVFKNLAFFNISLSDTYVLNYLLQGIKFATSDPRIVVPKPTSVSCTEV
jgi:hypothetical protein